MCYINLRCTYFTYLQDIRVYVDNLGVPGQVCDPICQLSSTQVCLKAVAESLKEIELSEQTIKRTRINEMNTIKQTSQNKNGSIIIIGSGLT